MNSKYLTIRNNNYEDPFQLPDFFQLPFELDHFQKYAIDCINRNEDVIVTAHTGSGKTIPAEYAIAKALNNGNFVIYTAPIKTLSNQKYKDFSEKFGKDNVGILTGDIKNNIDAPCLIMTTEILRNILYRQKINPDLKSNNPMDINIDIDNVESVIFDEVHYINDRDRGSVWEESIIMLDPKVNLIMLSATIDDADQFASWIGDIKNKNISLIPTKKRPVPLQHHVFLEEDKVYQILSEDNKFNDLNYDTAVREHTKMEKKSPYGRINSKNLLIKSVDYLRNKGQLPATYFVLNRNNCSKFSKLLHQNLITPEESALSTKLFNKYLLKYKHTYEKTEQYNEILKLLSKGIAIHHSGLIPVLKEAIEMIYAEGLIKVLFATETFAAGVNMPTKTVVFTQMSKFDGKKRNFNTDEYKQMAGRAGRRGLDTFGSIYHVPMYELLSKQEAKMMMNGKTSSIRSKFDINYKLVLKMMSLYQDSDPEIMLEKIIELANQSYMWRQNSKSSIEIDADIEEIKSHYEAAKCLLDDHELEILSNYHKLKEQMNPIGDLGIRVNPKQLKKQQKELDKFSRANPEIIKKYDTVYLNYLEKKIKYDNLLLDKEYYMSIIKYQIKSIIEFLKENGYVNENNKLSILGVIAKEINECNEIILSQSIVNNFFNDLTIPEIVGLISVFIEDNGALDEDVYISSLDQPIYMNDIIKQMGSIAEDYANKENIFIQKNNVYLQNDWNLHLNLFQAAYAWASNKDFYEVKKNYQSFEGNFIKNILRINNIVRDLMVAAEITKNDELYSKLSQIEPILIRDEVTVESLYVN